MDQKEIKGIIEELDGSYVEGLPVVQSGKIFRNNILVEPALAGISIRIQSSFVQSYTHRIIYIRKLDKFLIFLKDKDSINKYYLGLSEMIEKITGKEVIKEYVKNV